MVEIVPPHITNTGKRLIKSPKVYINDSGILTALLGLKDFTQLTGLLFSAVYGKVLFWRTWRDIFPDGYQVLQNKSRFWNWFSGYAAKRFYRHLNVKHRKRLLLSKGTFSAFTIWNLNLHLLYLLSEEGYPAGKGIDVVSLDELTTRMGRWCEDALRYAAWGNCEEWGDRRRELMLLPDCLTPDARCLMPIPDLCSLISDAF